MSISNNYLLSLNERHRESLSDSEAAALYQAIPIQEKLGLNVKESGERVSVSIKYFDKDFVRSEFIRIVAEHLSTITDSEFSRYRSQADIGALLPKHVRENISKSNIIEKGLLEFNADLGTSLDEAIGSGSKFIEVGSLCISYELGSLRVPVWFFPFEGVFRMGVDEQAAETYMLEIWLSWPALPEGW